MAGNLIAILPEILILAVGGLVLVLDVILPAERRRMLGWLTFAGLLAAVLISLSAALPGAEPQTAFGGMVRQDWLGFTFKMLFLVGAALTSLLAMDYAGLGDKGEFYLLLLASTLGMCLMASAADLIMLYLAIETTSIPLYVLAGFITRDDKSAESGFKYLLFGALTSTVMLYGFSLLYGFTGSTSLAVIAAKVWVWNPAQIAPIIASLLLVLVGFGFKISAVPFHFWAPDVYEGAPTPVAGFLSTASKAAGFAVLLRFLLGAFDGGAPLAAWQAVITALAVASMTLGNLLALAQKNIKRLLAYSSIAHAGYMLIGVVAIWPTSNMGVTSVVFYLIAYLLTNLAAFGAAAAFARVVGSDEIYDYAGMSRRAPGLALVMMVAFLSLSGMPPFGGFVAKVFVFAAAMEAKMVWLAIIGVLNSIVGLYYYLTVLKVVYLYRAANPEDEAKPLPITRPYAIALTALSVAIILIGAAFGPWFEWTRVAAASVGF